MLELQLTATDLAFLEAETLRPDAFVEASADDVRRHKLWLGNQRVEAGELFAIDGDPAGGEWRFVGDLSGVHRLGEGMTGGSIDVEGPVGDGLGKRMTGGRIAVSGDAGDRVGEAMRGGRITVRGRAGDEVGAAMRRGLIVVRDAGELAGYRMKAGTILVLDGCGGRVGLEMVRGTIGLFGESTPALPPTFRYACDYEPAILGPLATQAGVALPKSVKLFSGDLLRGGRGEVLMRG